MRGSKKKQYGLWEEKAQTDAEYSRTYRERNPDAAKAAQIRYREKHQEEIKQRRYDKYHADLAASRKVNREKSREWRAKVQGGFHRYHLNRYYGNGAADHYAAQFERQDGKCAVCDALCPAKGKLHLDHNHSTKQFRGLLCGHCNRAIGLFRENPSLLQRAVDYLREWQDRAKKAA